MKQWRAINIKLALDGFHCCKEKRRSPCWGFPPWWFQRAMESSQHQHDHYSSARHPTRSKDRYERKEKKKEIRIIRSKHTRLHSCYYEILFSDSFSCPGCFFSSAWWMSLLGGRWRSGTRTMGFSCWIALLFFLFFSSSPIVAIMERPVRGNGQTKPTRRLEEELAMVVEDVREIERRDGVEVGMDSAQE